MLLTNLVAADGRINTQYKWKLKEWNCTKEGKGKNLTALERGSTRLAQYSNKDAYAVASFCSWYGKAARTIFYLLAYRTANFSYLTLLFNLLSSCFTLLYFFLPFYWDEIILKSLPSSFGRKNSKTFSNNVFAIFQLPHIEKFLDNSNLCLSQIPIALHRKYSKTIPN